MGHPSCDGSGAICVLEPVAFYVLGRDEVAHVRPQSRHDLSVRAREDLLPQHFDLLGIEARAKFRGEIL